MDQRSLPRVLDGLFGTKPKPLGYDRLPTAEQVDVALAAALGDAAAVARLRRLDKVEVSEPLQGCAVCGRPAKTRRKGLFEMGKGPKTS